MSLSQQKGLYELYCCDNEVFMDQYLTYSKPHNIQKLVLNVTQGKHSDTKTQDLLSENMLLKLISLVFAAEVKDPKDRIIKPYVY